MPSPDLDALELLLPALKENRRLASRLRDVCLMSRQQRFVEIETWLYENPPGDTRVRDALRLLVEDGCARRAADYLAD